MPESPKSVRGIMAEGRVHLSGIGGTGMSALAEVLKIQGFNVSGSDRFLDSGRRLRVFDTLSKAGVIFFPQDGSGIKGASCVVASAALDSWNPDLTAAAAATIPVVHRSRALAAALSGHRLLAVSGTSGKSTVTAMIGHILNFAGMNPLVVNGAPVVGWDSEPNHTGAVLDGSGEWAVAETDESDRSLLNFSPDIILITNVSSDHFPLDESNALFDKFASQATHAVIDLRSPAPNEIPQNVAEGDWSVTFTFRGEKFTLLQPGRHNACNAAAAAAAAMKLGIPPEKSAAALASFRGVRRRMEMAGIRKDGVRVIDDYSHNTEKIRAALDTMRSRASRVIALWRPHGYAPLRKMYDDLADMFASEFSSGGVLFVLPVFDAGGDADRSIQSDSLVAELVRRGADARFVNSYSAAITGISAEVRKGDIIGVLGARDPDLSVAAAKLTKCNQ